jgi:Tfp pilus assembly protein PilF
LDEQLDNDIKSKHHLSKALSVDPNNDAVRWSLARLAVMEQKYLTAERLFDEIKDPAMYVRAQIQVANMQSETQGIERAVSTLRGLKPRTEADYLEVAITRHYLLMGAREYDEAFGYINETLVYLPDNLELLYARALVAAELAKIDLAEQDLRLIIAQQPEHANALNALGYTLADQTDRYEEAKDLIVKALSLRPNDAHILDSMGWVSYRLKDFEGAIEFLQKAYEASPEAEVAAHLGEVLWESGEQEKARAVLLKSYSKYNDNAALNKVLKRYGIDLDNLPLDGSSGASSMPQGTLE